MLAFSAIMGFNWLGTVPLTSGLILQALGARYMATLYAFVYLSHQAGNFCGARVGRRVFCASRAYLVCAAKTARAKNPRVRFPPVPV